MQNESAFTAVSRLTPSEVQDKMNGDFLFITDRDSGNELTIKTKNINVVRHVLIEKPDEELRKEVANHVKRTMERGTINQKGTQ